MCILHITISRMTEASYNKKNDDNSPQKPNGDDISADEVPIEHEEISPKIRTAKIDIPTLITRLENLVLLGTYEIKSQVFLDLFNLFKSSGVSSFENKFRGSFFYLNQDPKTNCPICQENKLIRSIINLIDDHPNIHEITYILNRAIHQSRTQEHLKELSGLKMDATDEDYQRSATYFLENCSGEIKNFFEMQFKDRKIIVMHDPNASEINVLCFEDDLDVLANFKLELTDGLYSKFGKDPKVGLIIILDNLSETTPHEIQHSQTSLYWAKSNLEQTIEEFCIAEICSRLAEKKNYQIAEIVKIVERYSNNLVALRVAKMNTPALTDNDKLSDIFHSNDIENFEARKPKFIDELTNAWDKIQTQIAAGTDKNEIIKKLIYAKSFADFL